MGRPSKYKPEYVDLVRELCLLGATDAELAEAFDVSESTLNNWKGEFPEFLESIKKAKLRADAVIAGKLYARAEGYDYTEQQAFKIKVSAHEDKVEVVEVLKHAPPDPTSMIFWLKNRQPDKWRDVKAQEISAPGGGPVQFTKIERELVRSPHTDS